MAEPVSLTVHINAPADEIYALVSDLPRMGEWSPENTGGKWLGGATSAAPGVKFKGTNQNGSKSWTTTAKIVEATPGQAFVFDVAVGPLKVARWTYRIVASDVGCDVTEQWDDHRGGLARKLGGPASGVTDRATYVVGNIKTTLDNLKAAAEAS